MWIENKPFHILLPAFEDRVINNIINISVNQILHSKVKISPVDELNMSKHTLSFDMHQPHYYIPAKSSSLVRNRMAFSFLEGR